MSSLRLHGLCFESVCVIVKKLNDFTGPRKGLPAHPFPVPRKQMDEMRLTGSTRVEAQLQSEPTFLTKSPGFKSEKHSEAEPCTLLHMVIFHSFL